MQVCARQYEAVGSRQYEAVGSRQYEAVGSRQYEAVRMQRKQIGEAGGTVFGAAAEHGEEFD